MLVDSGADTCVFDIEVADILEIDLSKCRTEDIFGITCDHQKSYIERIPLTFQGKRLYIEARFMPMGKSWYGVVGQKGFFGRFIINFDYLKKEIEIKEWTPNKQKFKNKPEARQAIEP